LVGNIQKFEPLSEPEFTEFRNFQNEPPLFGSEKNNQMRMWGRDLSRPCGSLVAILLKLIGFAAKFAMFEANWVGFKDKTSNIAPIHPVF